MPNVPVKRLTLAGIEHYVRQGYALEPLLKKYGYIKGPPHLYIECEICGNVWDTISPCAPCNATSHLYRTHL